MIARSWTAGAAPLVFGPFDDAEELLFVLAVVAFALAGGYMLYTALKQFQRSLLILRSDPVPAAEVEQQRGTVELQGTAEELDGTISPRFSSGPSLAYTWKEQRRKVERDSDGNEQTKWETIGSGENATAFRVSDDTGSVVVDPSEATLSLDTERAGGGGRKHRRFEGTLDPGDTVHVIGAKRTDDDGDAPGAAPYYVGGGDGEFLISDTTELRTAVRYLKSGIPRLVAAAIALGFTLLFAPPMLSDVFGIQVLWGVVT